MEVVAIAATAAAPQKHNNQLVYGRGALGGCIGAIYDEKEEEKGGKHQHVHLEY
jgi:hypothetical protein